MDEKENTRELVVVDVKHYKKVKKALHESEERYRQLFENVPIGIYRTTRDGRIVDANPALIKMLGFESFAELATRNLEQDYAIINLPRADFIKRLERDGEIIGLEAVWSRKDGSWIHVRENAKLTKTADGEVLFEGTVEDITASKQIEAAQKIRTQQLEILNRIICSGNLADSLPELLDTILQQVTMLMGFEMAAIYLFEADSKHMTIKAHKGLSKGFLRKASSISIADYPFSQILTNIKPLFADHLGDEQPQLAQKWHWRTAACIPLVCKGLIIGTLNVAGCQRSNFTDSEKEILDLIGKEAGTLISKLQTETALHESEKYYRTLIDTSPDIIVVMDLDAKLLTVNQQFLRMGGYFYDEVIGGKAINFISGLDLSFLKKKTMDFIKKKEVSSSEYLFKKKDGCTIPLEVSASILNDDQGRPNGIIAIGRDVIARKEAEAKLLAYQEQLRALTSEMMLVEERERRRIACELHDQIGQNLALCKLKLAAMEKNLDDAALKGELAVVSRLLECSIQDARSLIFDLSPPVLYELGFSAALEWLAERIQEQFHVPVEFESRLRDPELKNDQQVILFQVVRELLINVGKHSRASQAKIILSLEEPFLKIQVNDDGVGFDASQIFAPREQNSGFGFFSMRERLNYLGGGLEVKSKPGQGSQIILKVPQLGNGAAPGKENS